MAEKKLKVKSLPRAESRGQKLTTMPKKTHGLIMDVFDMKGKVAEQIELPKEIFGAKINKKLMSQAVRVYLANQRRGTASTKTRGEVSGSTRKIWAQKHTGRARHGSIKAPIFVGGGIVFGPKPRDFSLNLSKKMKRMALFSALSAKLQDHEIKGIIGLEKITPKTKLMVKTFAAFGISNKTRKILLVTPGPTKDFENVSRAARNIEGVDIMPANALNAYEVLNNKLIILMKDSINTMQNNFLKEESRG